MDWVARDITAFCSIRIDNNIRHVKSGRKENDTWTEEWACFSPMTWGFHNGTEETVTIKRFGLNERDVIVEIDTIERDKLALRYLLQEWSLGKLEKDSTGALTDECYEEVLSVDSRIINCFVDELNKSIEVSEDDRKEIDKQSAILFNENSRGVNNPNKAISDYCSLTSMAEKFDLNYYELLTFPLSTYMKLKMVMGNEAEIRSQQSRRSKNRNKGQTRVSGGGKSRVSSGITIPNPT